jgi:hypothetical protein
LKSDMVTLTVPPGWSPPPAGNVIVNCVDASGLRCPFSVSNMTVSISIRSFRPSQQFTIEYQGARAPDQAGPSSFDAEEGPVLNGIFHPGSLVPPTVAVICPDGVGSMTVSPSTANVSKASSLTFTYTAAGCGVLPGGEVAVAVPPGWSVPATGAGITASSGRVTASPSQITVTGAILKPGQNLTLHFAGTAPASADLSTFSSSEESAKGGKLIPLASSPQVTVTSLATATPSAAATTPLITPSPTASAGGHGPGKSVAAGTMTVSPTSVVASRAGALTFTFTASRAGLTPSGSVVLTVPRGWTTPVPQAHAPSYTSTSAGKVSVSHRRIRITGASIPPRHTLTIVYHYTAAPPHAGNWIFKARAGSSSTTGISRLATSPMVTVTAAAIASSSQLTAPWIVGLVVIPCVLLAAAAWVLQRRARLARPTSVAAVRGRAVPGVMTVRNVGPEAPLIVRIEPHASSVSIRTEEAKR